MEELKELISMVANLPNVVLWVLIGYLIYKLVVVGSIYATTRLAIVQFVSAYNANRNKTVTHIWQWGNCEVLGDAKPALEQLLTKAKIATGAYLHKSDVVRLSQALDLLETQEREDKRTKSSTTTVSKGL